MKTPFSVLREQCGFALPGIVFWAVVLISCMHQESEEKVLIEDFSLDHDAGSQSPDYQNYYQDLEKSSAAVPFRHSFPIGISVGGKADNFEQIPKEAFPPLPSRLTLKLGERCLVFMKTGPVQVNRFLFTGDWIKFGEEIAAQTTLKLESDMDINVQMSAQLVITIPKRLQRSCWKLLYGRKTYIGSYGLQHSGALLHPSPNSEPNLLARMDDTMSHTKVYLHWLKGGKQPVLRDELDFPAVVRSPMYRARLGEQGFYYLSFQPVLRMRNVNRLVLSIPVRALRQKSHRPATQPRRQSAPQTPANPTPGKERPITKPASPPAPGKQRMSEPSSKPST